MENPLEIPKRIAVTARNVIVAIVVLQTITIATVVGAAIYLDQRITQAVDTNPRQ